LKGLSGGNCNIQRTEKQQDVAFQISHQQKIDSEAPLFYSRQGRLLRVDASPALRKSARVASDGFFGISPESR
jgi:hypothetical protein